MVQPLRFLPARKPVFALSPAGCDRVRWAVWSHRGQVEKKAPIATGFAASEAIAVKCIDAIAPGAVRSLSSFASPSHLARHLSEETAGASNVIDMLEWLKRTVAEQEAAR